jgi:hypothetical protein
MNRKAYKRMKAENDKLMKLFLEQGGTVNDRGWAVSKSLTQPSNSRFNVADLKGNPIPDEIVTSNMPPWFNAVDKIDKLAGKLTVMDEFDKASVKVKRRVGKILAGPFTSPSSLAEFTAAPSIGKTKDMKKLVRKFNKQRPRGTPKLKLKKLKMATFKVPDAWGYLVPSK